ncbi:hypothetical protein TB2_014519 [Malus domestica]
MQTSRIADFKHCRIDSEEADDEVRAAGYADAEGGAVEALEGELALANEGAGIMDRIMQIVVHCSGADLKVESGVTTDLDRKSLLASDNSNGSIDNIVGSNSVLNANNVQKVKKDGDQVVGSNEGIRDKKSNSMSSKGSKLEGKDKKQKQSDGLESKEVPKEVDNGANTVFVNLIGKEGTWSEECDTSNICTDEGNQLVACLKVLGNAMILASAWMCISFRNRRVSGSGLKYQKLDKDLPISNGKNRVLHVNDVWDNNWDDNWDDEEAPHTPLMPITPSLSGKGLASRRLNKEA